MLRCTRTRGAVPAAECFEMLRHKPIKGNRLPAGANHLAPECNRLEPRANRQRPGAEHLKVAPRMLRNVKVSHDEVREKTHRSPREARENSKMKRERTKRIYKRSPSEHRESRFNFEGTSRAERRGNAENVTGRMMKNDEIPKEAKRKQRERRSTSPPFADRPELQQTERGKG